MGASTDTGPVTIVGGPGRRSWRVDIHRLQERIERVVRERWESGGQLAVPAHLRCAPVLRKGLAQLPGRYGIVRPEIVTSHAVLEVVEDPGLPPDLILLTDRRGHYVARLEGFVEEVTA